VLSTTTGAPSIALSDAVPRLVLTLLIIGATAAGATGRRFARTIGAAQKPNAFARATIRSTPAMYAS